MVPKFVNPSVTPTMLLDPDFVILPLANGVLAVGRTRMFCQVRVHGLPPALLEVIVIVRFVVVTMAPMVAPLARLLMFLLAFAPPFITTVGRMPPVSKTKPAGTRRTIVPVPTSPLLGSWYTGPVRLV